MHYIQKKIVLKVVSCLDLHKHTIFTIHGDYTVLQHQITYFGDLGPDHVYKWIITECKFYTIYFQLQFNYTWSGLQKFLRGHSCFPVNWLHINLTKNQVWKYNCITKRILSTSTILIDQWFNKWPSLWGSIIH